MHVASIPPLVSKGFPLQGGSQVILSWFFFQVEDRVTSQKTEHIAHLASTKSHFCTCTQGNGLSTMDSQVATHSLSLAAAVYTTEDIHC